MMTSKMFGYFLYDYLICRHGFFFTWKHARKTQQYFPTLVYDRGAKPLAILAEGLTPKDSRLEPVTSP